MENSPRKSRSPWLLPAAIVVLVALWLLSGLIANDDTQDASVATTSTSDASALTSVRVRTQSAEPIQRTIIVNGNTAPARFVTLAAETDGRIASVVAERGANVERGETIVRLDERDRSARLRQAEATVKQREVEFQARERLKSQSYVSEAQLQEAVALLESAKAELTRAKLDLGYMNMRAPFGGALQSRAVEVGDFVSRGDPVATFVDNRRIIIAANLSELDAQFVKVDNAASAKLATGETVEGRIRYLAPVADESTRTFRVELEIDNSDGLLRAGGTAELRIPAETVSAQRIASSLLTLNDAGDIGIKLVDDDGRVKFVEADIALSSSDGIWVAGLPETVTLITVGQGYVNDGALVNAVPEDNK